MRVRTVLKKEEIVSSAATVFREYGFERASMSEIAAQVGSSKATLYGYFNSKEELFVAVTHAEAQAYFDPVLEELSTTDQDIATALQRFGEKAMAFVVRPSSIASRRMVLAVAGHSDIGQSFYTNGPKKALQILESFLKRSMERAAVKRGDPWVMAQQFVALVEAELIPERLYGVETKPIEPSDIHAAVARAVQVFLAAYRP
jgi:AcrR family transcriptional regulator